MPEDTNEAVGESVAVGVDGAPSFRFRTQCSEVADSSDAGSATQHAALSYSLLQEQEHVGGVDPPNAPRGRQPLQPRAEVNVVRT